MQNNWLIYCRKCQFLLCTSLCTLSLFTLHFHYINIDKWILNLSQKLQFISKYLLTLSQNFAKFLHNDCATDFVVLKMTGPWYEEYLMNSFLTHKAYFFMHLLNSQLFLGPIYNSYWSDRYLNFKLSIKNESLDIYRKVASTNASRFVTRLAYMHTQNDVFLIRSSSRL